MATWKWKAKQKSDGLSFEIRTPAEKRGFWFFIKARFKSNGSVLNYKQ
jgi:hypothetical protein